MTAHGYPSNCPAGDASDEFDPTETVPGRFEKVVKGDPNHLAVKGTDREYTYGELNESANGLARLVSDSVPRGGRVVIYLQHGARILSAILGVLKAGRIYVPIDPGYPSARNRLISNDAEPALVVTDAPNFSAAMSLGDGRLRIVNLDEDAPPSTAEAPDEPVAAEDFSCLLYTSGSTGQPKGVIHTHQTLLRDAHERRRRLKITPNDRMTLLYSSSVMGAVHGTYSALMSGATLFPNNFNDVSMRGLIQWMRNERITVYHSVTTVFRELVSHLEPGDTFPDVRIVTLGGERALRSDLENVWKWFPAHCEVSAGLGSTETGSVRGWLLNRSTDFQGEVIPNGYSMPDIQLRAITEGGRVAKPGEPGEIVITSQYIFKGYWRDFERTKAVLSTDPDNPRYSTYRTGDHGVILPDGLLVLGARTDKQVSIRGFRVELGEIESVLLKHPNVVNAAVILKKSDSSDSCLSAYTVASKRDQLSIGDVRDYLRERLPGHMVPVKYAILEKLPTTPNGKTDRKRLQDCEAFKMSAFGEYVAPRDEFEIKLCEMFGKELQCEPLGIRTNFFDAGLTSLLALRLITNLERDLGRPIPLKTLFDVPNVAVLAAQLRRHATNDSDSSVIVINPNGSRHPIICLPGIGGVASFSFRTLAKYSDDDRPFHAVQLQGLEAGGSVVSTVEEMAADRIGVILDLEIDEPYYLIGYSFGGRLVLEMALQLRARGCQVALVGLIDSWAPGYPKIAPWTSRYRRHLSHLARMTLREKATYLRERVSHVGKRIRDVARRFQRLKLESANTFDERLSELEKVTRRASRLYKPRTYSGDVVLFRALDTPDWTGASFQAADNGWSAYVCGRVRVHDIPCAHLEILREPDVEHLGRALRECLDEIDQTRNAPPNEKREQ